MTKEPAGLAGSFLLNFINLSEGSYTFSPHSGQNLAPPVIVALHLAQFCDWGLPHSGQNLAPSLIWALQLTQAAMPLLFGLPHSGQNLAPALIEAPQLHCVMLVGGGVC
jgi:hypothetical protein